MPEALLALEEHSFRLPLTLPAERHVRSIIPPPPPPPTFEHDEPGIPPFHAHEGSLEPTHLPRDLWHDRAAEREPPLDAHHTEASVDDDEDELLEGERLRRARQASMQRWALLVTAPLAIIVIAALVRTAVIWGRSPSSAELHAANVATATAPIATPPIATATATAPSTPEPPAPIEKGAPPPQAPATTPAEQLAQDRAAAKKERLEAQTALEVGDARRAALAARRATALDPSEAQGWLVLVAAELDCKRPVAANEALASCLKLATRGPRGECIGMVVGRAARAKRTMDLKAVAAPETTPEPPPAPLSASPPPVPRSAP